MKFPVKDGDGEHPVPELFRPPLVAIVEAFRHGDFSLRQGSIPGVEQVDPSTAQQIEDYLLSYGEILSALPASTWRTSVSRWMDGYWDLIVDLYTEEAGESDLVLTAQVFEGEGGKYRIEVTGLYVP